MGNKKNDLLIKPKFFITIHNRQKTTWQGEITWADGTREGQSAFFRSRREMLSLMEEAVETYRKVEPESELKSWEGERQLNRDQNEEKEG